MQFCAALIFTGPDIHPPPLFRHPPLALPDLFALVLPDGTVSPD